MIPSTGMCAKVAALVEVVVTAAAAALNVEVVVAVLFFRRLDHG